MLLVGGHKMQYWCSQDSTQKQNVHPSLKEGAKHCDTLGMHCYNCHSCLWISCHEGDDPSSRQITINLQHHEPHTPYYDVAMPPKAAIIIQDLEWTTPNAMVPKIQVLFPTVTTTQIHSAWSIMSKVLWKRDDLQLLSAEILL